MRIPPPHELLDQVRALPAAAPLLARLGDEPNVYLVGGAVRDLLLGDQPTDLDLVVEGGAAAVVRRLGGESCDHDRFGTAAVTVNGRTYDIATARTETYSRPGALPDVTPATLAEDLGRRDFTVNAAAFALAGPGAGELTAVPGALDDLDARRLRVLHEESFRDDPTRLLRLARYAGRLGFTIEPATRGLAQAAIEAGALGTVSGNRVGAEVRLLAREDDPAASFGALHELQLDFALHLQFQAADPEVLRTALALLPADGRRDILALAAAARRIPPGELAALLDRLAFEAGDRDAVVRAARADEIVAVLREAQSPSAIARALTPHGLEGAALAGALGPAQPVRDWLENLRHVRLDIDGADLLAAGIAEGPALGRALRAALDAKLDGAASGREAELAVALRAARPGP